MLTVLFSSKRSWRTMERSEALSGLLQLMKPFLFLTGCFIFLSKKRIEDDGDDDQHNENKNEAHDNLVRHHSNQIGANQLNILVECRTMQTCSDRFSWLSISCTFPFIPPIWSVWFAKVSVVSNATCFVSWSNRSVFLAASIVFPWVYSLSLYSIAYLQCMLNQHISSFDTIGLPFAK